MLTFRPVQSRGFTLVEATLSVAIVGILLVASTGTFGSIARSRKQQVESRMAYLLAQQLMTEIMQCYFQQQGSNPTFGPVAGQTRSAFTYVDAYNGYSASPPTSQAGAVLTGYSGWSENVSVAFVSPNNPATVSAGSTSLKQITVTVTAPSGKNYALVGLRSQFGAYELAPTVQTNYITGVAVSLQGVTTSTMINTGAHPLNISSSQ
jgi:prepilin-type N-terminal cleavage/methylation domain-containing protein